MTKTHTVKKVTFMGNKTDSEVKNISPERAVKLNSTKNYNLFEIHIQFELHLCFEKLFPEKKKFNIWWYPVCFRVSIIKTIDTVDMDSPTWWILRICMHAQSCSTLCDPHGLSHTRLLCPWNFLGKNTGVGCHFLLQGIFPSQGLNQHLLYLLYWQADSLPLCHWGSSPMRKI